MTMVVFEDWLMTKTDLRGKSARDVISRVKRAEKYIDLSQSITDEELLFRLGQSDEFKNLSISVKSQIKRAVRLYRQFKMTNLSTTEGESQ